MILYVTLTDGESVQTREKGIEEPNDVIDTMTRFQKDEVIVCE